MYYLVSSSSRPRSRFDADRLQAASSLLSLGHMYSPISIATNEPDFNKAIASIIWSRHHGQATCTIFNCSVANCPLCPTRGSTTPRPTEVEGIQRRDSSRRRTHVDRLSSTGWYHQHHRRRTSTRRCRRTHSRTIQQIHPVRSSDERRDFVRYRLSGLP